MSRVRELTKKQRVAVFFMSVMGKSLCDIAAYYDISASDAIRIIQYYESIQERKSFKRGDI